MRRWAWALGGGVAGMGAACLFFGVVVALFAPSANPFARTVVVYSWTQPATVRYDQFDPYYLTVTERGGNTQIYVGRDSDTPAYGHFIDFTFYPAPDDLRTYLEQSEVNWQPQGVLLRLKSGHTLFVPAAMFTGGR